MISSDHAAGNLAVETRHGSCCNIPFAGRLAAVLNDVTHVRREDDTLPACILSKPFRLAMEDIRIFLAVVLRIRKNRYCEVKSHPDSPLEQLLGRFANHTPEQDAFLRISITLPFNTVTTH